MNNENINQSIDEIVLKIVERCLNQAIDGMEGAITQLTCNLYKKMNVRKKYCPEIDKIKNMIKKLKKNLTGGNRER